jgi:hypothetical protein
VSRYNPQQAAENTMNEDRFLSTPSPHEAFSMMLLERIERLEEDYAEAKAALESFRHRLPEHIPYEWFRVVFSMPAFPENEPTYKNYYGRFRETCINQLFSTRKDTHPLFAYWFWEVESAPQSSAERFYLTVYVRFRHWTTVDYLKTLLSPLKDTTVQVDVHPTQGGVGEVQMLLTKRLKYNHVFNYSVPEYGIDIWRWGGEEIEYPLAQEWSIGNFLESPNYRQPVGMRYAYLDWILHLIHNNNWVHLFRLYDYEKE